MKRAILVLLTLVGVLVGAVAIAYMANGAPAVPPMSPAEAAQPGKPYVVKLHARWCHVCFATRGMWSEIDDVYASRVKLAVFDYTDDATIAASRAEAQRIGLGMQFDEYLGVSGAVVVLDSQKRETAFIGGSRDFAEYRSAIDQVLPGAQAQ